MKFLFFITLYLFSGAAFSENNLDLRIETGAVWQSRNDVQISPSTGTRFEIEKLNKGPFLHYRVESYYRFNNKHALRLVYAPFEIEVNGNTEAPIVFNQKNFLSGQNIAVKYRFNSYRLSYLYGFKGFGDDQINLGVTLKVRDALIRFSQLGQSSSYDNVGLVPLIYFEYQKSLGNMWSFNFTVDAAAAPQGRAIDGAFKIHRQINKSSSLGLGIRSLEGGADNEKVYTFSWFNYALIDLKISF